MIYIAIGANLPNAYGDPPLVICERAARAVAGIETLSGPVRSRWFSSAPVPPSSQARYINGVLRLEGNIAPATLLGKLQAIEQQEGRIRTERNAARTLDLDIIAINGLIRTAPDPILPHPRAAQRGFVLLPLRDVAPHWRHPVSGQPICELIALLPPDELLPRAIRPLIGADLDALIVPT